MSSDQVQIAGPEVSAGRTSMTQPRHRLAGGLRITLTQVLILASVLGVWEMLTRITWFEQNTIFDPFFISRPSLIGARIWQWMQPGKNAIWPHLASTLYATGLGLFVGTLSGFTVGVLLAQSRFWAKVLNPFIVSLNSMPRIAFVPLITMLFGLGLASKVVTAWFMVFFLVFFNTYKGANSVEQELVNFCRTLGGRPSQILWRVRIPTAAAWTFASLPNAISFALIGVVLAEFVGSTTGVGYLLTTSLATLNATDMFASIAILSLVGVSLVYLISAIERRLLHWSSEFRND
ncbi:ABC transporter permease [Bradyrhizobium betae]|uniref:ABC transporter permease n=1 Tax=Bradyrhizobium betae TaxID=244734 RepID=UPI003D67C5C4